MKKESKSILVSEIAGYIIAFVWCFFIAILFLTLYLDLPIRNYLDIMMLGTVILTILSVPISDLIVSKYGRYLE